MIVVRSLAGFLLQVAKAALAASMARLASLAPISGTWASTWPVAGSLTAKVLPESAATHSPSM